MRNVSCIHSEIANNKFTFIARRKKEKVFLVIFRFRKGKMIIFELRRKEKEEKNKLSFGKF